jgi:hypothetical protein
MNRIAAKLKNKDGGQLRLGPGNKLLPENDQMDVNGLKAFWVFMNIIWIANHLVGDHVLLGYKHAPPQYVSASGNTWRLTNNIMNFFREPLKYNYVPTSEYIGRARPSDYVVHRLSSTTTQNLTGAFSQKLIDYLRSIADVEPSPQDIYLLQTAYSWYINNPDYLGKGIFIKDYPPFPGPYPKEWPTKIH